MSNKFIELCDTIDAMPGELLLICATVFVLLMAFINHLVSKREKATSNK
jgi:hypothetical protein